MMIQDILTLCENRLVLFDNKTKDESKKFYQVQQLLSLVNKVTAQNGGQPYTDEIFAEVKVSTFISISNLGAEGKGYVLCLEVSLLCSF